MATNRRKCFHRRHGSLITLANNGRTASRSEPSQEFNNGLVISRRPLKENEIFEVRIDKKVRMVGWEFRTAVINRIDHFSIMNDEYIVC